MSSTIEDIVLVFVLTGLPGSGKSTLAKMLSRRLGLTILSTDEYRRRDGDEYLQQNYYAELLDNLQTQIAINSGCVVDAMFYSHQLREKALSICLSDLSVRPALVTMVASSETCRQRIVSRLSPFDGICREEDFLRLSNLYEPVLKAEIATWPKSFIFNSDSIDLLSDPKQALYFLTK